jgi:hypothetical protein
MTQPLGVGTSTVYHMPSNHQTALNHSYRNESAYNPRLQVRTKCTYCGVWVRKGSRCLICKEVIAPPKCRKWVLDAPKRAASPQRDADGNEVDGKTPRTPRTPRTAHEHREPIVSQQRTTGTGTPRSGGTPLTPRMRLMTYHNANAHSFRDVSEYTPVMNTKLKCRGCGCWVTKGKACSVCTTVSRTL